MLQWKALGNDTELRVQGRKAYISLQKCRCFWEGSSKKNVKFSMFLFVCFFLLSLAKSKGNFITGFQQ